MAYSRARLIHIYRLRNDERRSWRYLRSKHEPEEMSLNILHGEETVLLARCFKYDDYSELQQKRGAIERINPPLNINEPLNC